MDLSLFPRGSTSYKFWRFRWNGGNHRIEQYHAWFSGQLLVQADGLTLVQGQRLPEEVTKIQRVVDGRLCTLRMQDFGMERLYECIIDREAVFSDANSDTLLRASYSPGLTEETLLRPARRGP